MRADEAASWGQVNRVVPASDLLPAAMALARQLCAAAPLALAAVKEVLRATEGQGVAQAFRTMRSGLPAYTTMLRSQDAQEGPRAFVEKRAPAWQGR
jgi:crotonobetainyl-CoA hydratase